MNSTRQIPKFTFTDDQVPDGWMGSFHIGDGVFRQLCRVCRKRFDSDGSLPRHRGIGPHEYEEHGLDVPGINVGILG